MNNEQGTVTTLSLSLFCPGGQDVAEEFRSQEIDGQALLLLTEDHLVSTMNLKLGPALKLCAHINALKEAWTVSVPPLKEWICVALGEPKTTARIVDPQTAGFSPDTTAEAFSCDACSSCWPVPVTF